MSNSTKQHIIIINCMSKKTKHSFIMIMSLRNCTKQSTNWCTDRMITWLERMMWF